MSQSPTDETMTPEYGDAFATIQYLIYHKRGSLSGREWNRSYLNLGVTRFAEVTTVSGLDSTGDGRAVATIDWDDDGRVDLILRNRTGPRLQFFRNQHDGDANFLVIALRGTQCNTNAIGARVSVELEGRTLSRTMYAGEGFLTQSTSRLHFGLGDSETAKRVTVRWPDGTTQSHEGLDANTRYRIVQGADEARVIPAATATVMASIAPRTIEGDTKKSGRIVLAEKLPLAELRIPAFDRADRKVGEFVGGPVLVNLWATTCANCLREFTAFQREAEAIDDSGLRIVTLTTDVPGSFDDAKKMLRRFGLEEFGGYADADFLATFEALLVAVVGNGGHGEWPLPMSLLLDEQAQLVAIYPAPVEVDRLLADVASLEHMNPAHLRDTKLQFGIRLASRGRNLGLLSRDLARIGQADLSAWYASLARKSN